MSKARILVLNEDRLAQKSLYEMLCRYGYSVEIANTKEESLTLLDANSFQIVLADINGGNCAKLCRTIREKSPTAQLIVLASYANIECAVKCIKDGAFDYLVRPVEDEKIISTIERAHLNIPPAAERPIPTKKISKRKDLFHGLVGNGSKVNGIYSLIERISNAKTTILLRGESGTGKRMVARAIHQADKRRKDKPFIELACGALAKGIVESELFGHTKGSFTDAISDRKGRFELAHGGTLLLDDIDALSLDLQVKLLRVLQHKEFERLGDYKTIKVDVRIVVATNHDLEQAVAEKRFREDLYYRLNVISITIPPLRERKEDIPTLVEHFVKMYAGENLKKVREVSEEALQILTDYNWPGNIRELENIIERAIILDTDGVITREDLPEIISSVSTFRPTLPDINKESVASLKAALQGPEKGYILKVLKEVGWNKKKAAKKLGVNRTTLYNKLRKYNLLSSHDQ